jgi:hypothetical protein
MTPRQETLDFTQTAAGQSLGAMPCSPFRVTLSRRAGWKMPPNTVSVARPHKWGNPYVIGQVMQDEMYRYINGCGESFEIRDGIWIPDAETAVRAYRHWLLLHPAKIKELRDELAGKDLACWCKFGTPCHADVLINLANAEMRDGE